MPGLPPVEEGTLRATYDRVLAASPDEVAQVDESGAVTFAESYQRSLRLAAGIAAHGIGHQEPAALLLDNSLDAVHVWSGIGLGGRVEVPVNTAYKGRFLTYVQGSTFTVPLGAMAELLQQQPPRPGDADKPMQIAVMAPLASDVRGFCQRFGLEAAAVCGMSEIGAVLDGPPDTIVGGEAGFARPGYELRLVDDAGRDVEPGQIGELWVKPADPRMVMLGYHNLPEKTAQTLVDGWVHTGDAFRTDEQNRFFFADRIKDACAGRARTSRASRSSG
jgi:acyl-CoA synthetase (AMP-forming)/AMP-acid ligase II